MTKRKKKIGRPATGRDPVRSFRLPDSLYKDLTDTAEYNDRPVSDILREALHRGLLHLRGDSPGDGYYLPKGMRPKHAADIHEAGHAAAAFIWGAPDVGFDPYKTVSEVVLKPQGAGHVRPAFWFSPAVELKIKVAGAVAQAICEKKIFDDVWLGYGCSVDRKQAAKVLKDNPDLRLEDAIQAVEIEFSKPPVRAGIEALARALPVRGKTDGLFSWLEYSDGVDDTSKHKPALDLAVTGEDSSSVRSRRAGAVPRRRKAVRRIAR